MNVTPFDIAQRFIGLEEIPGELDNEHIMQALKLDNAWPDHDEVPWCSAFANWVVQLCNWISPLEPELPRSRDLRARSWLKVGRGLASVEPPAQGFDVVVLKRGTDHGPDVVDAPGHVGFFAGASSQYVSVLGGNQSNRVKISQYRAEDLLSIRRLAG